MADKIEMFRDLNLRGPMARRPALRAALIAAAADPWEVDLKRSAEFARIPAAVEEVLVFRRAGSADFPAAGLTLWGTADGYEVTNIVPVSPDLLTFAQYNAILGDFSAKVAQPAAAGCGYGIETTEPWQTLEDWLSADASAKLRRFSVGANKATGASHPMDRERWFKFIIAAHGNADALDPDRLFRWLHEAEGWEADRAHRLAGDYETSLALLKRYDESSTCEPTRATSPLWVFGRHPTRQ